MDSMDSIVPVLEGTQPSRPSWSRRGFVMTSLATGFALAVQPVSAETITTDTNGLAAGEVKVPVKGGEIPAYRAMPANGGPFPTVLVASEVWGVHEHIKDICRRLAKAGYFAIAPELFTRQGDPSKIADTQDREDRQAGADRTGHVRPRRHRRLREIRRQGRCREAGGHRLLLGWLRHLDVRHPQSGVEGGGVMVRLGPLVQRDDAEKRGRYRRRREMPSVGVLWRSGQEHHPGDDREAAGRLPGSRQDVYPDAQHGFLADYRPSYNAADAKDGWARMLAWFKQYGAG
jgi:carboxymethylenebutenolidase